MLIRWDQVFIYLREFIYLSCNYDVISSSYHIASNGRMITELETVWKRAVVAWYEALSRHLPGGTEENDGRPRMAGLRADIWTRDLPNTGHNCYPLDREGR
jgi:hypothetical protein